MQEDIFFKQMRLLNRHLASAKINLYSLLKEEGPSVSLKDGSLHYFDRLELEMIADLLPEKLHQGLRLPIFIELSSSKYGPGLARILGRTETLLVSKILGKECTGDELFINRAELREVRRKLKTATQYMFTTSAD